MDKIIISDTSCLILLSKVDHLDLLRSLFSKICVTPEIQREYGDPLPDWISVESVRDSKRLTLMKMMVDEGEASAIALCLETPDSLLIMDERKGRKLAHELGLPLIGTLGILLEGKKRGFIPSMTFVISQIIASDFRISEDLLNEILLKSGESPLPE